MDEYIQALLALLAWREDRGAGKEGMLAVMCVVRNRVTARTYGDWVAVMTRKYQFSSLTAPGDPNLVIWPQSNDPQFNTALDLAAQVYKQQVVDVTNGATHYFNPKVVLPNWAASMQKVASLGGHDFYKV